MSLLDGIEDFLARTGMPPSMFGRAALRDPRFVSDLRKGRKPRRAAVERVNRFLRSAP